MDNTQTSREQTLTLTPSAAKRIAIIVTDAGGAAKFVRLEVLGGGCSGFQYKFGLDERLDAATDVVVERDGARLVIDTTSLNLLKGSVVDYGESLMEAGFHVQNPNATSGCGCGSSFSVGG